MSRYELDCHDCGTECTVARRNGKYCRPCALLRKLVHAAQTVRQASRSCRICNGKFAPMHPRDFICGPCTPQPQDTARCGICKQDAPVPFHGVAVCLACVKGAPAPTPRRDPDDSDEHYAARVTAARTSTGRAAVIRALKAGQRSRAKANATKERRPITLIPEPNSDTAPPNP